MVELADLVPAGQRIRFEHRPVTVPGDMRISWRLAVVALMLHWSRAQKASLSKLHILNSALRLPDTRRLLLLVLGGGERPIAFPFAVEPALGRALDFARAEDLVKPAGPANYTLTRKGQALGQALENASDTLRIERDFLSSVSPRLTESLVQALLRVQI
jgi:hypothetical protein